MNENQVFVILKIVGSFRYNHVVTDAYVMNREKRECV